MMKSILRFLRPQAEEPASREARKPQRSPRTPREAVEDALLDYAADFHRLYDHEAENLDFDPLVNGKFNWPDDGLPVKSEGPTLFEDLRYGNGQLGVTIQLVGRRDMAPSLLEARWYESRPHEMRAQVNQLEAPEDGPWWDRALEHVRDEHARLLRAGVLAVQARDRRRAWQADRVLEKLARAREAFAVPPGAPDGTES